MRKPWLALLACLAFLALANNARAEQVVLDLLIEKALKNYPELSAAAFNSVAASYSADAAGSLPDPELSIGLENLPVNSFSLAETPMSGLSVGLTQEFPWPGKLKAQSNLADVRYRRSKAIIAKINNRIIRDVTTAYYEYSYWHESGQIIEDYVRTLGAALQVIETRYANGNATAQDVLRISTKLSRTTVRWLESEQNSHASLLTLWRYVGDSSFIANLPVSSLEPDYEQTSIQANVDNNPELLNAELAVRQSEFQQQAVRADNWPDISIKVDYRFRRQTINDPVNGTDFLTFKLGLEVPFWFFSRQDKKIKSAEYLTLASKEQLRTVREMLTVKLDHAQYALNLTLVSIRQYENSILPEAKAAFGVAEVAYEVGQIDFNALLASQADLFEIQLEHLDLLLQFHQTRTAVAELAGAFNER